MLAQRIRLERLNWVQGLLIWSGLILLFSMFFLLSQNAEAAGTDWEAKYWNSKKPGGDPVLVRQESAIDYDWGDKSPGPGVNDDNFSARWKRTIDVSGGVYRYTATMDDGMRVWVDDQLIIDSWNDSQPHTISADISLAPGEHRVKVEYYDAGGGAVAKLTQARIGNTQSINFYNWRAEYFNNTGLSGEPAVVQDDTQISFNWGYGSPAPGISVDNFSARWTRTIPFTAGRYRFTMTTDDGSRLWVNNQLLIDRWYDHSGQTFTADIDLPNGSVPIRMEYYERNLLAEAYLSWNLISGTTTPPPAPGNNTAVVASYRANVRLGPGIQYGIITSLVRGTAVQLAGYRNAATTWVMVNLPNGSQGWIYASLLQSNTPFASLAVWQGQVPGTGGPTAPPAGSASATVNTSYLNCRQGPGVGFAAQTVLPRNTAVQMNYRNQAATWVRVTTTSSQTCWVNASYLLTGYPIANLPVAGS